MNIIRSTFLMRNFFICTGIIISLFILGSLYTLFLVLAELSLLILLVALFFELLILYRIKNGVEAARTVADRLSNGDDNAIYIELKNNYALKMYLNVIDELPVQFQVRDKNFSVSIPPRETATIKYDLRPTERGSYNFGNIHIFASTYLQLIQRRYVAAGKKDVAVYPSYLQVKKYAFMAISNDLQDAGLKKIRKIGHNYEFEHIREFVTGDDYRSINWNATAKRNAIMVNQYQDEKSQDVYALINKGRVMKMPFEEMTLLDHAINSALVMLNVAHLKDDKAGLLTFNKDVSSILPSSSNRRQMSLVLDTLYNQKTDFTEGNYEKLYFQLRHTIKKRSLVFLYTNFESILSLKRELPYLRGIAKFHRLIIVFFKNTELDRLVHEESRTLEAIYVKTIATKFQYEKELIVKELQKYGIDSVLTSPQNLTVNAINKYLEIKAKRLI